LVEATFVPLALFYTALGLVGVWGALLSALIWSYACVLRRALTGQRIPGILVPSVLGLTVRTSLAMASGSVFVYFLQPSLGSLAVGAAYLFSVSGDRTLAQRLAADFCPLPEHVLANSG